MKKLILTAIFLIPVFFGNGCFFYGSQPVAYYDLIQQPAAKQVSGVEVTFRNFKNISPALLNMAYRQSGGKVLIDRQNVWVQSPEMMLQRYFMNSIKGDVSNDQSLVIGATLFDFTIDLNAKLCRIGVNLQLNYFDSNKIRLKTLEKSIVITQTLKGNTPSDFCTALSECAANLVEKTFNEINNKQSK